MVKNDIVEQIVEYVMEDRFTQAIMLDGAWGAGKTYFVKNILMPALQEKCDKRIICMSLYGVTDKEQLKQDICMQNLLGCKFANNININPKKIRSIVSFAWPLLKGLIQTGSMISYIPNECISVVKNMFKVDSQNVNTFIETINDFIIKDCVIIFDDMERCGLSLNNLYGVVSNLLEENGVKVILIANQEAIGIANLSKNIEHKYAVALNTTMLRDGSQNKDDNSAEDIKNTLIKRTKDLFAEDVLYKSTKEKVVGLTIAFHVILSEVYEDVVNAIIKSEEVRKYLLEKQDLVLGIFSEKTCYNVRVLIFALIAFEKFYITIKEPYPCACSSEEYCTTLDDCKTYASYLKKEYESILIYTVSDAISIKMTGKCVTDTLLIRDFVSEYGIALSKTMNKYIFYYLFVDDYLSSCNLNKKYINKVIWEKIHEDKCRDEYIAREQGLVYSELENWVLLEDDEVREKLSQLLQELKEGRYSPLYFKEIIKIFIRMKNCGFRNIDYAKFIQYMRDTLESCIHNFNIIDFIIDIEDNDLKNIYDDNILSLFQKLEKRKISVENYFKEDYWNKDYVNMCKREIGSFVEKGKFLFYMNQEDFIRELTAAKIPEIYNFIDGVNVVYNVPNAEKCFQSDVDIVNALIEQLEKEIKILENKEIVTRKLAVKALVETMQKHFSVQNASKNIN